MSDFPEESDDTTPATTPRSERNDDGADDSGERSHESNDLESQSSSEVSAAPDSDPDWVAADEEDAGEPDSFESRGSGMRGRDVEVPMRVYKTVTVFSTLIAVVCVVGGFILIDRATQRAQLPLSEVDPVLALLGVGTILFGAATYAFGTRFRAAGMGRSKNDDDEAADNG